MKKIVTVIFFCLLQTKLIIAQSEQRLIKYLHPEIFSVKNGLSQGLVSSIAQDHFGFIWFGTLGGLNRYDGYNVKGFTNNPDDSSSVAENNITVIFKDSKNRLWIGTTSSGLDLFNYENERFIHFRHDKNLKNSLSDDHILSIAEDRNGALWVATKHGLNKITITEKTGIDSRKNANAPFLSSYQVFIKKIRFNEQGKELFYFQDAGENMESFYPSFFTGKDGAFFVETKNARFCIRPSKQDEIFELKDLKQNPKQTGLFSNIKSQIRSRLKNDEFLFRLAKVFVAEIDPQTGIVSLIRHFNWDSLHNYPGLPVESETIWFTWDFNLYQYNATTQSVVQINSNEPGEKTLMSASIIVYRDRTGLIWVGSSGYGVAKFNPLYEKFHCVKSASILCLRADLSDEVMVNEANKYYTLQKNLLDSTLLNRGTTLSFFNKLYMRLKSDDLINGADIKKLPGLKASQKVKVQHEKWEKIVKKLLPGFAYFEERDQIWFAEGEVLHKVSRPGLKETNYSIPAKSAIPDFYVETIFKDAGNILWLGTSEGLFSFNEKKLVWNQYTCKSNDTTSLSSNLIFSICAAIDSNYLWISTNGHGFNHFNKNTGICTRFTTRNGLPNNVVYAILMDDAGNLWMSTNKGLSKFYPIEKRFENFSVEDGLQDNEFNRHAYCKTSDGTMFFGGVNGYNYFNPKEIKNNLPRLPVRITGINFSGKSIEFSEKDSPLSEPVYLTKKIVLDYKHNSISFDFSTMDYTAGSHEKYQYKVEGVDKNWVSTSTNHSAIYSNLQPGSYLFQVKEENPDEDAKVEEYASVDIVILPPWYRTWWFTAFLLIFSGTIIYLVVSYLFKQSIKIYKDHQRIASDLHDEIGSTLSNVHIYSEVARSRMTTNPIETEKYLKQISSNVKNTIESLDDIVWMLKSSNDRFEDIANRMRASAVNICEATGYSLKLNFDKQLNEHKFNMEALKNMFLIFKEAVNNVMKYADGKNLFIDLLVNRTEILLSIKDDGKGFDMAERKEGKGIGNMQKRARILGGTLDIKSAIGTGTQITLRFPH